MSLEPHRSLTSVLTSAAWKTTARTIISAILTDVYDTLKGHAKSAISKHAVRKHEEVLYEHVARIRQVRTIWSADVPRDILDFYYPLQVEGCSSLEDLFTSRLGDQNILIEGTVGQGKSMFMRYLCSYILLAQSKIPAFVELRQVQGADSSALHREVTRSLSNLGFDTNGTLFRFLAQSGRLVLVLDGADELTPSCVKGALKCLEDYSKQYTSLKIICSSRPQGPFGYTEGLSLCRIKYLSPEPTTQSATLATHQGSEIEQLIRRLAEGESYGEMLITELRSRKKSFLTGVLTTPLAVTLLTILYKHTQDFPDRFSDFYEELFIVLLRRHDAAKSGFDRERKCKIGSARMREVFTAFCLGTREHGRTFPRRIADSSAAKVVEGLDLDINPDDFVEDIIQVTNLLLQDVGECCFIHKSVQEYFGAAYIAGQTDDSVVREFYEMLTGAAHYTEFRVDDWREELLFLREIDEVRFHKWFILPLIERLSARFRVKLDEGKIAKPSKQMCERILRKHSPRVVQQFGFPPSLETGGYRPSEERLLNIGGGISIVLRAEINVESMTPRDLSVINERQTMWDLAEAGILLAPVKVAAAFIGELVDAYQASQKIVSQAEKRPSILKAIL